MSTLNTRIPTGIAIAAFVGLSAGCIEVRETPEGAVSASQTDTKRSELVAMTWNLDWFQDPERGPTDDARQFAGVRDILERTRADLIALQEVTSRAGFERLRDQLDGYDGVVAGYDAPQKTALLWSTEVFHLRTSRSLTGLRDAGRPPLEVSLQALRGGPELLVCVIHAKAETSTSSYAQRLALASSLKAHFDLAQAGPNATQVILIGDYNDLLIGSLTPGEPSPYRAFVEDRAYAAPTLALNRERAGEASYAWGATVDHVIVRNRGAQAVGDAGTQAMVLREELLADTPDFVTAISDHFPVSVVLHW